MGWTPISILDIKFKLSLSGTAYIGCFFLALLRGQQSLNWSWLSVNWTLVSKGSPNGAVPIPLFLRSTEGNQIHSFIKSISIAPPQPQGDYSRPLPNPARLVRTVFK